MQIDDINASEDITMTELLIRLFAAGGCKTTICHACDVRINVGDVFKLVPHPKIVNFSFDGLVFGDIVDEMCCINCGSHELKLRDASIWEEHKNHVASKIRAGGHGFSRVSRTK